MTMDPILHAVVRAGIQLVGEHLSARTDAALNAAEAIVRSLLDGMDGKTDPSLVIAEIETLRLTLATDDKAADAELAGKFDKSNTE